MNSVHTASGVSRRLVVVTRVADRHWHALEDDEVVGRGVAVRRPDGRYFLGIDSWHCSVFDRLADAMLTDLPRPLYTLVDETDDDLAGHWWRAGFRTRRRERVCLVPTDPRANGLGSAAPPTGVAILPVGAALEGPLRALDRVVRDEVEATLGWQEMPAEVLPRPDGGALGGPVGEPVVDPSRYAVALEEDGRYAGLLRLSPLPRQPRLGLIAVRADRQRRGIARALLAEALGAVHRSGVPAVSAEVNEANPAAVALFESVGAVRESSNLELVAR
ncbi:GNAT family N-acetyltransferase [Phaeacidiphilus oryzae]|uniref:GNAT family N-acetyltransferase n=1 Tax=Phaeacidiphilus oryzae TaxID=348818 RepID=UPI00055AB717|nr:GNAT family N-acetyltransferase [Phaeacidiphilus oryzae]